VCALTEMCRRVVRPDGHGHDSRYVQPTFRSGRLSLPFWGAIAVDKKWPLVFLDLEGKKGLSAKAYTEQVVRPVLSQMVQEMTASGRETYVVEDGARCHTAKVTQEARNVSGITSLQHPAQSPDLNPIEDMWLDLKTKVATPDAQKAGRAGMERDTHR
jgi:transposase